MKKIFATLLLALTTMAASAQDNPNRLIIQPKQGNPSGYLVERLDSVYFTKINGRVAADINLQGYTTGATGDTLRLAVTKTPECQAYRIACVPASMANALTSDAVVAQYFDLYVGGDMFTEDFTNAVMTNMGIEFKPNSDYSVITMGYDKYGIACASSRVDFTTPAANIIGNPTVTYKVLEANYEDFTIDFQPNEDCLGFYACAFEKGTAKAQYEQAYNTWQNAVLKAGSEVSNALVLYNSSEEKSQIEAKQIEVLQKNVEQTRELVGDAGSNYLDIITAQSSLLNVQLSKVADDFYKMQAVVNLYYALGGGAK